MIIRQEINIVTGQNGATNLAISCNELAFLDTTKYSGSVSYYFEVIANATAGSTGNVRLRRKGTTTDDATIPLSSVGATTSLTRSSSFTPNPGGQEYFIFVDAAGVGKGFGITGGRIIIIQNTGASNLTATETQIELGATQSVFVSVAAALTNTKYFKYDSANWDGTITAFFEAVFNSVSTKITATATLQVADGTGDGFAGWVNVTNASVTSVAGVIARVRSIAITLTAGRNYRIVVSTSNSKNGVTIYNAKLIIDQSSTITKLEAQYLLSSITFTPGTALQTFLSKWDSTEWSGVTNIYKFVADAANNSTSVVQLKTSDDATLIGIAGTNVATDATSGLDNQNRYDICDSYTPFVGGGSGVVYDVYNGNNQAVGQSFTGNGGTLVAAEIEVDKSGSPTGNCFMKIYAHTGTFGSGTGTGSALATSDALDTSTLGSGLINLFVFSGVNQIILQNGVNYVLVVEYASGDSLNKLQVSAWSSIPPAGNTVLRDSTGTWTANPSLDCRFVVFVSNVIMPSNQNLDIKATTNNSDIYAAKILVQVVKIAVSTNKRYIVNQAVKRGSFY